jgi:hypothetical protein
MTRPRYARAHLIAIAAAPAATPISSNRRGHLLEDRAIRFVLGELVELGEEAMRAMIRVLRRGLLITDRPRLENVAGMST